MEKMDLDRLKEFMKGRNIIEIRGGTQRLSVLLIYKDFKENNDE